MSKIKLIICDLDGTMLANKMTMRRDVKMIVQHLQEDRSILFVPATGRHWNMCPWFQNREIATDYVIANNGSVLVHFDSKRLKYEPMMELFFDSQLSDRFLLAIGALGMSAACITNQPKYFVGNRLLFAHVDLWTSFLLLHHDQLTTELMNNSKVYQWTLLAKPRDIDRVIALIRKLTARQCKIYVHSRRRPWNIIEINPLQSDKWYMTQKICDLERVNRQQVMAIGNGENDMEMIKHASVGVCPSTSPHQVLALADITFTWNLSQGLVSFLTNYFYKEHNDRLD